MKTLHLISALTILLFATTSLESNAFTPNTKKGAINFEGNEMLLNSVMTDNSIKNKVSFKYDFQDEAYINDIPFNTECVSVNCRYKKAMAVVFEMEDEKYIDDIPFNTEYVVEIIDSNTVDFETDAYIDDIPFNTQKIATRAEIKNNLTVK